MILRFTISITAVALAATALGQAPHIPPPPVGGHLAMGVLLGGPVVEEADIPADLPSADRLRLKGYLDRRSTFESQLSARPDDAALGDRRLALEREMASVIEQPGIDEEAAAIAESAPLAADVTGNAAAEADWAEGVLRERSSSPAAPYLYAFLASRYRLTFEQTPESDKSLRERLARKYKTMLDRVRSGGDTLFVLLADDLDGLPRLSPDASAHPREYLPDT